MLAGGDLAHEHTLFSAAMTRADSIRQMASMERCVRDGNGSADLRQSDRTPGTDRRGYLHCYRRNPNRARSGEAASRATSAVVA